MIENQEMEKVVKTKTADQQTLALPYESSVHLDLTIEQAHAVSRALDLFARMGIGQMREIAGLVRDGSIPFSPARLGADRLGAMNAIDDLCADISNQLGFMRNANHGIGGEQVPASARRAYEVGMVLEKALAEHRDPNPSFRGVNYNGLTVRYTSDPEPSASVIAATIGGNGHERTP